MKFTPKQLNGNINVSRAHPLTELFWLLGGLILATGLVFLLLGFATDWAAEKIPVSVENWLGEQAVTQFPGERNQALEQRLQALLAQLPADSKLHQYNFRVVLSPSEQVNAVALPGGTIVVFAGLLKQVRSENELAMILAHELGHFAHRDHLRGLGRGLGLTVAAALLFGEENAASDLIAKTLMTYRVRYSRAQESAADRFALDLLNKRYGHVGGSTDFFVRMAKKAGSRIPYLLASHPHPQARIDQLDRLIKEKGYLRKETRPLTAELRTAGQKTDKSTGQ
ncbi:MAG: M48 family metallopeptidase [Deltaproteobacteria bacterium]|nr:M48 family metallopeptidase [Deltaproteobacteria bacterium]